MVIEWCLVRSMYRRNIGYYNIVSRCCLNEGLLILNIYSNSFGFGLLELGIVLGVVKIDVGSVFFFLVGFIFGGLLSFFWLGIMRI